MVEPEFTIGDLVTHGTYVLVDDPQKTVYITRDGDLMHVTTAWKGVQATFDLNASDAADYRRSDGMGDFQKVARVPLGVYHQWADEGILEDQKALNSRLNNGDFSKFRVNDVRV